MKTIKYIIFNKNIFKIVKLYKQSISSLEDWDGQVV